MDAEPITNDKLYTLDAALDVAVMREVLEPIVAARHESPVRIQEMEVDVLRRRNKRCVVRYRMRLANGNADVLKPFNLIGKVFKEGRGEPVYEDMESLWDAGLARRQGEAVSMPQALTFLPDLCLLVQEEVPGLAIKDALRMNPSPHYMRQVAQALIKLHGCGFVPRENFRMREHLSRCHPKYPFLQLACPDLEDDIDHIVNRAIEIESHHSEEILTAIHGDFHMGQMHVDGERIFLIDFDALAHGDPAADLGNLLVFLKGKAKKMDGVPQLIDALLDEYFQHMDSSIGDRIPLYEAITHLRRACKRLRFQRPRWEKKVRRMVHAGVECIDSL